mgnify:CR=1 FL=1
MQQGCCHVSPTRRNVTIDEVGNVAAFLLSNLASGVTAEITYVDGGHSKTMGVAQNHPLKNTSQTGHSRSSE